MPPKKPVTSSKFPKKVAAKQPVNGKGGSQSKTRLTAGRTNKTTSKTSSVTTNAKTNRSTTLGTREKGKTKDETVEVWLKTPKCGNKII